MCLRFRDDDRTQVGSEGSRTRYPSDVSNRQSTNKRIQYMQNLRKEKRKLSKRFARPTPLPEPGLHVSKQLPSK
ncbi:coiled-coil domain-containing protein 179 [Perognathus longimembris pacificus]|uniref:coiled-coil domain-containing protein 179 n=1 Tax=Perognathus longimembris pacificus TaxID=214514 RepID=UPI00201A0EF1|nr:coiled-coil domain-containing protein 179 [Perognathus longimembris pacificus]